MGDETVENILIVFLKYPEPGRVKTRLAADIGPDAAASVYRLLVERTLSRILPSCGFDCRVFFDPAGRENDVIRWLEDYRGSVSLHPQRDGDLGKRMSEAFCRSFAGVKKRRIVIIGTDCPGVDGKVIEQAFSVLEQFPVVVGPSRDGGYYLLGMSEACPWLFDSIAWSTDLVMAQTVHAMEERQCEWTALPELQDIDTLEDLESLWPSWRKSCG